MKHEMQGNDISIEISLKEYGFAWEEKETSIVFYYGLMDGYDDDEGDTRFKSYEMGKNLNLRKEYNWTDFEDINNYIGMEFDDLTFTQQVFDLWNYYGSENIFGCFYDDYYLTYEEIVKD